MARLFDRNMFIMLLAIMVGIVIITYFIGDIVNRSKIETLTTEHIIEIKDVNSKNENFTDNFLQGSIYMDAAREIREVGNYHFDFALFWFNNALVNTTENLIQQIIGNCTNAMDKYLASYQKFSDSKPKFSEAKNYTSVDKYIEVLGYYIGFAQSGENITLLRYNASRYLMYAAENLSLGQIENVTLLMENFSLIEQAYELAVQDYNTKKDQIDGYLFFNEIREES